MRETEPGAPKQNAPGSMTTLGKADSVQVMGLVLFEPETLLAPAIEKGAALIPLLRSANSR